MPKLLLFFILYLSSHSFEQKGQYLASYRLHIYSDWWCVYRINCVKSGVTANGWIPVCIWILIFQGRLRVSSHYSDYVSPA